MVVTPTMLVASGQTADNEDVIYAIDKLTGERMGQAPIPGSTGYGMSSWVHEGKQYILVQLEDGLAAMALP
jgi:quinoprotein glucose dehydrogenase